MVGAIHQDGLRVVLDQVFNHTAASGQADKSVLDQVVPGYYHRLDATGAVQTSTCCQNVATEHAMGEKLMVDSVVSWAKNYKVDGFRFDLMGHHSRANMLAVRAGLDALTLKRDGVDGKSIYLYGEGWNFGEVADNALFTQATQGQLGGTHIGTFSDRLRDAVRGGGPFDEDPRRQGFGSGEATDPNGADINAGATAGLAHDTDLVQLGLAGNLKTFSFTSQASGTPVTGDQVDYNGQPAGYADQPDEVVSYVDAHDNETLFDSLTYKLPVATSMADRVRMNTVSLATTALAQTPSFWHAGADLLRSKSLDRDSYDSGDWFNRLDWTGADNGFGHGLPPEAQNSAKWPYMKPLLADPALKPSADEGGRGERDGRGPAPAAVQHAAVPPGHGRRDQRQGQLPGVGRHGRAPGCHRHADRRHGGRRRGPEAQGCRRRLQRLGLRRGAEGPRHHRRAHPEPGAVLGCRRRRQGVGVGCSELHAVGAGADRGGVRPAELTGHVRGGSLRRPAPRHTMGGMPPTTSSLPVPAVPVGTDAPAGPVGPVGLARPRPRLVVLVSAAVLTFLVIGLPTDIVANPVFGREVPVRPWELPVLVLTSVLTGLWFGLQRAAADLSPRSTDSNAPALGAAGLAYLAVACPVCNKIVLLALGTSGALGIWQPLQPWLAGISLISLLGAVLYAARRRPCADGRCVTASVPWATEA